jgi:hypothetical protein
MMILQIVRGLALLLLVNSITIAQSPTLPAAVYTVDDLQAGKLNGSTRFFSAFNVQATELKAGNK